MGKRKNKKRKQKKPSSAIPMKAKQWRPKVDCRRDLSWALEWHQQGELQKAEKLYHEILKKDPRHPDALHLLGVIMTSRGDYSEAIELIRSAIQAFPNSEAMYINLANALSHADRKEEALGTYRKALSVNPQSFDAYKNIGSITKKMGRPLEAIDNYRKALEISPDSAETFSDMGNVLAEIGRLNEALDCYNESIRLNPNLAKTYNNMGSALKAQERYPEAIDFYCKAVERNHSYAEAFNNLGSTIADIGKPDEAIKYFQKALEINPDLSLAQINLYYAMQRTCDWRNWETLNKRIDRLTIQALQRSARPLEDPFLNLARHSNPELNFMVAEAWSTSIATNLSETRTGFNFNRRYNPDHKVKLGYISHNFRNHAMAHLLSGVFENHNRDDFKVYGYSCGENDHSEYRQRIKNGCDKFVDIRDLSHLEAAKAIYNDRVDILIDLMGYTRGGRIEIPALRPSPIQIRYMGMAGTTGANFFDYLIADQIVVPQKHGRYYSEKLIYFPECYQINDDQQSIADIEFEKRTQGLPEKGFIFCSFNQALKLDKIMFDRWMQILKSVPGSVLWLQAGSKSGEENLIKEANSHGIDASRIVFGRKMSKAEHLARLRLADLALDTRLVNGAATTSDALWAGLPVITCQGENFSSRMSSSILTAIGLDDLVMDCLDDYQAKAISLATNPLEIESVRRRLHENLNKKPLFDTRRQVENLENAYKKVWKIYVSGEKPKNILL